MDNRPLFRGVWPGDKITAVLRRVGMYRAQRVPLFSVLPTGRTGAPEMPSILIFF